MNELVIVFWYWWMLAVGFLVLELIVPGFFFLWLAVSAFIVGSVLMIMPIANLEIQILLFSLLSVISVMGWRQYAGNRKIEKTDHPFLNQRGAQYIGRTFNLVTAIENGQGKIKVGDSLWLVKGNDCPMGGKVTVVAVKGTVLEVEVCH